MFDLGENVEDLRVFDAYPPWTGVSITYSGAELGRAGDETGRVLVVECPWGTDIIASDILDLIHGDPYQPFEATNAILDPAAEIGDPVIVDGLPSTIVEMVTEFDGLCASDISAPSGSEINRVFPYYGDEQGISGLDDTIDELQGNIKDINDIIEEILDDLTTDGIEKVLYSTGGDVANLTVDRVRTSRRIVKYLAGDTSDDNFVQIEAEKTHYIAGLYIGGETQAKNQYGDVLFWEADPQSGTIGRNGYPYINNKRIPIVTEQTQWPVTVYNYEDQVKASFAFEQEGQTQDGAPIYTPTITLGAGNQQGTNLAKIRKGTYGLSMMYKSNADGREVGIQGTTDGYLDLYGLRRTVALNFSTWDSGSFTETVEGSTTIYSYSVTLTDSIPVAIQYEDGLTLNITW